MGLDYWYWAGNGEFHEIGSLIKIILSEKRSSSWYRCLVFCGAGVIMMVGIIWICDVKILVSYAIT